MGVTASKTTAYGKADKKNKEQCLWEDYFLDFPSNKNISILFQTFSNIVFPAFLLQKYPSLLSAELLLQYRHPDTAVSYLLLRGRRPLTPSSQKSPLCRGRFVREDTAWGLNLLWLCWPQQSIQWGILQWVAQT